jgi:Fe2+ or Zn2+ uptake regulation protein
MQGTHAHARKGKPRTSDWSGRLRAAGLKATSARIAVLATLVKAKEPLGAQEIAKAIGSKTADTATVYRVINSLVEAGMVRVVSLRHDHVDYELADLPDHHHLVCLSCGKVEDFTGCGADDLAAAVLKRSKAFAELTQHSLEFFGTCKECAK